eukprot:TRINITY_DN575_c4_g4_i1.p1 TRINITY_DN575_c4_g4~~TRINITY_DN575_c4_g4_i1.p1  ORF type:complete len:362 (+),score=119.41 TRINITY_DN575_c4_g4_i1:111-1088(+)
MAADGADRSRQVCLGGFLCAEAPFTGVSWRRRSKEVEAEETDPVDPGCELEDLAAEPDSDGGSDSPRVLDVSNHNFGPPAADGELWSPRSAGQEDGGDEGDEFLGTCESSHSTPCSPPQSPSARRHHGHPLGREALKMQQEQIAAHHNERWEEATRALRERGSDWSIEGSAARAKVLVAEGYFLERRHLIEQLKWLETPPAERRPGVRFGQAFDRPTVGLPRVCPDILQDPSQHRELLLRQLRDLNKRWGDIYARVGQEMSEWNNFDDVIRVLSTMRIFLQGEQGMYYGEQGDTQRRRASRIQQVLAAVNSGDSLFLPKPDGTAP